MCEQERAASEILLGEHDVGRPCGVGGHDRFVLQLGRFGEDVLDVERSRFEPLQLCALGELLEQVVVIVGSGGNAMCRLKRLHRPRFRFNCSKP